LAFSEIALKALQNVLGEENATNDSVKCQAYSRVQWTPDGILQRDQIGLSMRPAYVQKQLGHSSISITVDTYGHWISGEGRQGLEKALLGSERNRVGKQHVRQKLLH
jgi:hypothetical protein